MSKKEIIKEIENAIHSFVKGLLTNEEYRNISTLRNVAIRNFAVTLKYLDENLNYVHINDKKFNNYDYDTHIKTIYNELEKKYTQSI